MIILCTNSEARGPFVKHNILMQVKHTYMYVNPGFCYVTQDTACIYMYVAFVYKARALQPCVGWNDD